MKSSRIKNVLILIFMIISSISCALKDYDDPEVDVSQDGQAITRSSAEKIFPVRPGTAEWSLLKTERERVVALQVPESVLAALSSKEVANLCIDFPAFYYFNFFEPPQNGFSIMTESFNLFKHFLSLNDAGKYLIPAYKDADMKGFRTLPHSNELWTIKLKYLELLLVQKAVLQSLTPEEKFELIAEARVKLTEKIHDAAFGSVPGIEPSLRIMATILDMEKYPGLGAVSDKEAANQLIQTGSLGNLSLIDEIAKITDEYITGKSKIE